MFRTMIKALWPAVWCAGVLLAGCGGGGSSDPRVARLEPQQHSALLTAPGQARQLSVRAVNAAGDPVDATVAWTSSAPEQVSVDASGTIRSVTPLGSAQVFAEAGGVRSRPVLVSTVELHPGTLLVDDAQVVEIGAPLPSATGEATLVGTLYDVWLQGVPTPEVGTVVLASETAAVAGVVVETQAQAKGLRVRLRIVSSPDLVARYDIHWVIDLTAYDLVFDPSTPGTRQQAQSADREHPLDETEIRVPDWNIPAGAAEPICKGEAAAKLKTSPATAKVTGSPKVEVVSSKLQPNLPPGTLRVALVGDFLIESRIGLTAEASVTGGLKCELPEGRIPVPLPAPIGPAIGLSIPVTFGIEAKGEVELASLDIGLSGRNGAKFELGIDCVGSRPCKALDTAEPINEFGPHLAISDAQRQGLKVKLSAFVYFKTGVDFVLLKKLATFEAVEARVGPKQSVDFGTLKRQVEDGPYASTYDLKFLLELSPGKSLKSAIELLTSTADDGFSFTLPFEAPVSESPNGRWAPDKDKVIPGRDTVNFDIALKSTSLDYFLIGYNVEAIEVYRKGEADLEFQKVATLGASAGQARFQWQWQPVQADAGRNEFAVFAVSKLPVVRLEIGSTQAVQVGCIPASPPGREQALDAVGVCKEQWVGRGSGLMPGVQSVELPLPFTWEQDLSTQIGPGISALRPRPKQSHVVVRQLAYTDLGCSVTPERFEPAPTSLLTIDRNFVPATYAFSVEVQGEITISCPGQPPLKLPTRVVALNGLGQLSAQDTHIEGGTTTPQGQTEYRFELSSGQVAPAVSAGP